MSLIPTWPFVAGALVIGSVGGAALDHTIMASKIERIELASAKSEAEDSKLALDNYKAAAEVVTEAALGAKVDVSTLGAKLDAIRKGQKNVPLPPLPIDCKPGPVRLRNLAETAAAADSAIVRPVPSK